MKLVKLVAEAVEVEVDVREDMRSSREGFCETWPEEKNLAGEYNIPKSLQCDFGKLFDYLGAFATDERNARFHSVVGARTRAIVPVFENTHHNHNISAILRSADALGLQEAYFCYSDKGMHFRLKDSVERGSSTWLSVRRAVSVEECARYLRASGHAIALVSLPSFERTASHYQAQLPSFAAQEIGGVAFEAARAHRKVALVFGNELKGVSEEWNEHADMYVHIDMHGFVESLNVSVCAGILIHTLRRALEANNSAVLARGEADRFCLAPHERALLLEHWIARSVIRAPELVQAGRPDLWPYFDFVRKGLFFDPFGNLPNRRDRL